MKFLYWLFTLGWYFSIVFIATTYWRGWGWWFLVICLIALLVGDSLLKKLFKK